MMNDEMIKW